MPSASSLFLCCFCCRKLFLEIFSELDENLRRFFIEEMRTGARRATPGRPTGQARVPAAAPLDPRVQAAFAPRAPPSAASDAYKLSPDEKP